MQQSPKPIGNYKIIAHEEECTIDVKRVCNCDPKAMDLVEFIRAIKGHSRITFGELLGIK